MKNDIEFKQSQILNKKKPLAHNGNPHLLHMNVSSGQGFKHNFTASTSFPSSTLAAVHSQKYTSQHTKKQLPKHPFPQRCNNMLVAHSDQVPATLSSIRKLDNSLKTSKEFLISKASTSTLTNPYGSVHLSSHSFNYEVGPMQTKSQFSTGQTTSVCQRPEKPTATTSCTTTFGSPSKTQAIWSHSHRNSGSTAFVSEGLKDPHSIISSAPIYVSPSKTEAIWSQSSKLSVNKLSTVSNKNLAQSFAQCKLQNDYSCVLSVNSGSAVSSKFKLVKPISFSQTASEGGMVLDKTHFGPNVELHSQHKTNLSKTVIKTCKSKVSQKFVSKYKVAMLSPTSVSKFKYKTPEMSFNKSNTNSTPYKCPKREILTASKVVSKYKLKRISPLTLSTLHSSSNSLSHQSKSQESTSGLLKNKPPSTPTVRRNDHTLITKPLKSKTPSKPHKKNSPHFKRWSYTSQFKRVSLTPRQNAIQHHYVAHERDKLRIEPKQKTKSLHKLDCKPGKTTSFEHFTKDTWNVNTLNINKHRWVSPIASSRLNVTRKQQIFNSRFKWTQSLTTRSHPSDSSFNWPRKRFLAGPHKWYQKDQRSHSWMAKPNLVMIRGVVYSTKRQSTPYKTKNHDSSKAGHKSNMKLITVRGSHFHTDFNGKKLCRAGRAPADNQTKTQGHNIQRRSKSQGKAVGGSTILAASRVVHRSIVVAAAKFKRDNTKWKREKQYCMFFTRFGKCHRGKQCKYVHDPEKIAVCTRFLRGKCDETRCQFSHNASEHKMPVCLHYLQGLCSRKNCPYLHVRVNPDAPVCKDFQHGYCSLGKKCKNLHSLVCPSFALTGQCSRGESCSLLHRRVRKDHSVQDISSKLKAKAQVKGNSGDKQSSEMSACSDVGLRPCEGNPLEIIDSNLSDDRLQVQDTSKSQKQLQAQQNSEQSREVVTNLTQLLVSTLTTSSRSGSAPLASQPSFISLHLNSPASGQSNLPLSGPGVAGESKSGLSIKPQFMSQKLLKQGQDNVHVSKDTRKDIHKPQTPSITNVPTPAFLSSKMYKGNL